MIKNCPWLKQLQTGYVRQKNKQRKEKPLFFFCPFLIGRDTVAENFIIAERIIPSVAAIASVAFNGVNSAVFHLFHDTHMIGKSVLWAGGTIWRVPIKEDNHTRRRLCAVVSPLSTIFEPLNAIDTACKFRDDTIVDDIMLFRYNFPLLRCNMLNYL